MNLGGAKSFVFPQCPLRGICYVNCWIKIKYNEKSVIFSERQDRSGRFRETARFPRLGNHRHRGNHEASAGSRVENHQYQLMEKNQYYNALNGHLFRYDLSDDTLHEIDIVAEVKKNSQKQ